MDESRINENDLSALQSFVEEVDLVLKNDAICDHSVGICWCSYLRAREQIDELLLKLEEIV